MIEMSTFIEFEGLKYMKISIRICHIVSLPILHMKGRKCMLITGYQNLANQHEEG